MRCGVSIGTLIGNPAVSRAHSIPGLPRHLQCAWLSSHKPMALSSFVLQQPFSPGLTPYRPRLKAHGHGGFHCPPDSWSCTLEQFPLVNHKTTWPDSITAQKSFSPSVLHWVFHSGCPNAAHPIGSHHTTFNDYLVVRPSASSFPQEVAELSHLTCSLPVVVTTRSSLLS